MLPEVEEVFARSPQSLKQQILAINPKPEWVVIDEVQKLPKLLDVVHSMIESDGIKFILTGSSARKLKRGAANLLAGRAFVYSMHPLCVGELGDAFVLDEVLRWGSLPQMFTWTQEREKLSYLKAYVRTYFAEEVRAEQLIRNHDPFRAFSPTLGQVSGKIINHSSIAKQVGVSTQTIQSYFQIIEDTLLGFYLPAFPTSVRKSMRNSPKFYLFDTGVKKALEESPDQSVNPRNSTYGELFESFLINELKRLNDYCEKDYRLSFLATKNDVEVDLILSKNNRHFAVEIKSSEVIDETKVRSLEKISSSITGIQQAYYLSRYSIKKKRFGYLHALA